jgi:preprotein translocase subunit SecE
VARDRKRRRRRPEGEARGRDDVARDIGLGPDDDAVDSPLGEGTAAPDPLRNSSADVDEARLAEAGATPPPIGDDDDDGARIYDDEIYGDDEVERAPDEVQGDAVMRRRAGHVETEEHHRRSRGRLLTFFGHCIDELRRVQWPNRRQVGQATAVVLGFVVIAGGYLGLLDQLWQPLIEAIL